MFKRNKNTSPLGELDQLGVEVIRASLPADEEVEKAASSPFLFTRVMADIQSRDKAGVRRSALDGGYARERYRASIWAYRLRFVVAVLFVFGAMGFWVVRAKLVPLAGDERVASEARLTACSVSNRDKCTISTEDVLQLLVSGSNQEVGK
jgi:hypothetical protein